MQNQTVLTGRRRGGRFRRTDRGGSNRKENRMSTQTQEAPSMATRPIQEHQWLQHLVGEWRIESEMTMEPGQPKQKSQGRESVRSLGGLWAVSEGDTTMPDGTAMRYY